MMNDLLRAACLCSQHNVSLKYHIEYIKWSICFSRVNSHWTAQTVSE